MGRHAKRAVPLVQREEERGQVQRDEDAHPHGPVQRPHEGADGGRRVFAADLGKHVRINRCECVTTVVASELRWEVMKNKYECRVQPLLILLTDRS